MVDYASTIFLFCLNGIEYKCVMNKICFALLAAKVYLKMIDVATLALSVQSWCFVVMCLFTHDNSKKRNVFVPVWQPERDSFWWRSFP